MNKRVSQNRFPKERKQREKKKKRKKLPFSLILDFLLFSNLHAYARLSIQVVQVTSTPDYLTGGSHVMDTLPLQLGT